MYVSWLVSSMLVCLSKLVGLYVKAQCACLDEPMFDPLECSIISHFTQVIRKASVTFKMCVCCLVYINSWVYKYACKSKGCPTKDATKVKLNNF